MELTPFARNSRDREVRNAVSLHEAIETIAKWGYDAGQLPSVADALRLLTETLKYVSFIFRQPDLTPYRENPSRFVGDTYDTVRPAEPWDLAPRVKLAGGSNTQVPQAISFSGIQVRIPKVTATELQCRRRFANLLEDILDMSMRYSSELIEQHGPQKARLEQELDAIFFRKQSILEGKILPSGNLPKGKLFPEIRESLRERTLIMCQSCLQDYCAGCLAIKFVGHWYREMRTEHTSAAYKQTLQYIPTKELRRELKRRHKKRLLSNKFGRTISHSHENRGTSLSQKEAKDNA